MTLRTGHKLILALGAVLIAVNVGLYLAMPPEPAPVPPAIQFPPPEPPPLEAESDHSLEREEPEPGMWPRTSPSAAPTEVKRTDSDFDRRFFEREMRRGMFDDEPERVARPKELKFRIIASNGTAPMPFGGSSFGPWDVGNGRFEFEP